MAEQSAAQQIDGIIKLAGDWRGETLVQLSDAAQRLFNARLESKAVRAIDFGEDATIDEAAFTALIREAVELNTAAER